MATDYSKKMDDAIKKVEELEPQLTDAENKVADILCDNIEIIPPGFFEENSVEALNKHFGGKGDMVITDRLKEYMTYFQEQSVISNAMIGAYVENAENDDMKEPNTLLGNDTEMGMGDEELDDHKLTEDEIIDDAIDLQMTPPDMYESYEKFLKYLPDVWPNAPKINRGTFDKIRAIINKNNN